MRKYDVLLKLVGNNDTLCKMCSIIESGNDRNPITCLIDQDRFEKDDVGRATALHIPSCGSL
ncbi:MAG: hypothetical protein L6V85_05445 [Clostridiales bacterium]|nr:MAG: hypothetical protein L6V85_05445 [Clostridiales bacterium]